MSKKTTQPDIPTSYEAAFEELEAIRNLLENEQVPLDQLAGKVERARWLVQWCREQLSSVADQLDRLMAEPDA